MKLKIIVVFLSFFCGCYLGCIPTSEGGKSAQNQDEKQTVDSEPIIKEVPEIVVGAARFEEYLPLIKNKKIALLVNQTSVIGEEHLADILKIKGISISKIFAPEHGFRGEADAGESVKNGKDAKTGIPIISLYGKRKKPTSEDLEGIETVVFDIQDVGARFYTYISSMSYVMEACAEFDVGFLVLDRPNPNGHYVDGPILKSEYSSFVGLHEVPVVHGMTVGEYAKMVNGEGWLKGGKKCILTVIPCENYDHKTHFDLLIKPSPNLPNSMSIALYPSLCFFEGTNVSVGRGTDKQFQIYGSPTFPNGDFEFTPKPKPGAKYPKHEGKKCVGFDLTKRNVDDIRKEARLNLGYLIDSYRDYPDKENFFLKNLFFDNLAGNSDLRKQIIEGKSEEDIRATWQDDLNKFKSIRKKYLLYNDF